MNDYEALLTCYRSGQIPEPEWQEILREDDVFCKWYEIKIRENVE